MSHKCDEVDQWVKEYVQTSKESLEKFIGLWVEAEEKLEAMEAVVAAARECQASLPVFYVYRGFRTDAEYLSLEPMTMALNKLIAALNRVEVPKNGLTRFWVEARADRCMTHGFEIEKLKAEIQRLKAELFARSG